MMAPVHAADGSNATPDNMSKGAAAIEKEVNALRSEATDLERDIGLLEKDLLFPPLTRVEVFLSIAPELNFSLKNIALSLDDDEKSFHVYTAQDITALQMGGVQQFWEGNVALGQHEIIVDFMGVDVSGQRLRGSVSKKFEKTRDGLSFEIQVSADSDATVPKLTVKTWKNR